MDPVKIMQRYEAANTGLAKATKDMRKAQSLAWNEGARITAYLANALVKGLVLDTQEVARDCDGVVTLGKRAQQTEVALDLSVEEFAAASDAFMQMLKGGGE